MNKCINNLDGNNYLENKFLPFECPYCKMTNIPITYGSLNKNAISLYFINRCLNCNKAYLASYDNVYNNYLPIEMPTPSIKPFNETIQSISSSFVSIYNEAYAAEQMGLYQICGVGYRKALEFLVKDYLISKDEARKEEIKRKNLSQCINEIEDDRIKQVAHRATWLGNDETHYVRKWEDKDVSHLKTLIDLCTKWMDAVITTEELITDMSLQLNNDSI